MGSKRLIILQKLVSTSQRPSWNLQAFNDKFIICLQFNNRQNQSHHQGHCDVESKYLIILQKLFLTSQHPSLISSTQFIKIITNNKRNKMTIQYGRDVDQSIIRQKFHMSLVYYNTAGASRLSARAL